MREIILSPKVDETREFIEIANDFSNPLELVREAISNAFDAKGNVIHIYFDTEEVYGEKILVIGIKDNGQGMDIQGLQSFFDLGNSLRRGKSDSIGEKGHGTKVYFNSSNIEVKTSRGSNTYKAYMEEPYRKLYNNEIPEVKVEILENKDNHVGTEIIIKGYNNNRREKFTHEIIKDYIYWFTKFGSVEGEFQKTQNLNVKLYLKGLNVKNFEELSFGHIFPEESITITELFDKYLIKAPNYYCKRIIKSGQLKNHPEVTYEAIFSIEGNKIKQNYNKMLRRSGYQAPKGAYTVQERYGIWICKDYIPIQRKNEWISKKGSEYTKFHTFINCQDLKLTANRGSIENTPHEILEDLKNEVIEIYKSIIASDDWMDLDWLEDEAGAYRTTEREKKEFKKRITKVNKSNIAKYKGITLIEPQRESGVFALTLQIMMVDKRLFPFIIIDYDTHSGIDVIVKGNDELSINQSKLFYVEFKNILGINFNHSFENLYSIICWDTEIKHNDRILDINKEQRTLKIIPPKDKSDYTRYYLDHPRKSHRIEVFVLKDYLREKLGIEFRPRTEKDTV